MYQILTHCPLFRGIDPENLENLFGEIRHHTKTYSKGELIAQAGDEVDHMVCVLEGSVKAGMLDYSGKAIKIEDIAAPRVLAIAFIFGKQNQYPVNIVTNEEVKLLFIPKMEVVRLMQSNKKILINYLNAVSSRTQFLTNKIKFLSFKTIRGKLAQYLLSQSGKNQKHTFDLPVSQTELADFFGVTRPSLARVLGELQEEGVLAIKRRQVEILNGNALREMMREH